MDAVGGYRGGDDWDGALAGPSRSSWVGSLGSALLRLLFAGVAVLAAHLYLQQDGDEGGGRWGLRGRGSVCAAFAALGAVLVLTVQSEVGALLSPRACPWDWEGGRRRAGQHPAGAAGSHGVHPGGTFESWMFECITATAPAQEAAPEPGREQAVLTRPVFVRLEGRVLSVWSCGTARAPRVPRAALCSEDEALLRRARSELTRRRQYHLQDGVVSLLPADLSRTKRWSRKYPICIAASEKLGEEENVLAPTTPSTSSSEAPAELGAQSPPPATSAASTFDLPSIMVSAASTPLASFEDFPAGSQEASARTSVDSTASSTVKISPTTSATSPPVSHKDSSRASNTSSPTVTVPAASVPAMFTAATNASSSKEVPASASIQPRMSRSSGSDVSDLSVNFADVTKVCDVEDVEERLLGGIMSQEIIGLGDDDVAADEIGTASAASTIGVQGTSLLLLARTARQKEEWFRRLRRATGEPHPLDDAAFLEDYVASLQHYLDDDGDVAEGTGEAGAGADPAAYQGLNALAGRVLFDACHSARWAAAVREHVQKRVASVRVPAYMERPVVSAVRCRHAAVKVLRAGRPRLDAQGLWVDLDVSYRGVMQLVVTSRLNLTSQQQQAQQAKPPPSRAPTDLDDNGVEDQVVEEVEQLPPTLPPMLQQRTGTWRIFKRLAESRFFQAALLALSNTDIVLVVEVRALDGVLCVHVPPPPSDGVWLGFRGVPCLRLAAVPRVGSRTLRHALLCRLIERRLRAHMERVLVLPNMVNMLLPFT